MKYSKGDNIVVTKDCPFTSIVGKKGVIENQKTTTSGLILVTINLLEGPEEFYKNEWNLYPNEFDVIGKRKMILFPYKGGK